MRLERRRRNAIPVCALAKRSRGDRNGAILETKKHEHAVGEEEEEKRSLIIDIKRKGPKTRRPREEHALRVNAFMIPQPCACKAGGSGPPSGRPPACLGAQSRCRAFPHSMIPPRAGIPPDPTAMPCRGSMGAVICGQGLPTRGCDERLQE